MAAVRQPGVPDGISMSRVSATLKKVLSFGAVEIALRGLQRQEQRPSPRAEERRLSRAIGVFRGSQGVDL